MPGFNALLSHQDLGVVDLRNLVRELRNTINTLATGLTRCNRDMRYVWANPAYAELAGVPLDEIVGRPIAEVMGEEALAMIRPYIDRVLGGERVEYEEELPWQAHGPRWIHVVYAPYAEEDGTISGWVASVTDISRRKRAEQQQQLLLGELNHRVRNTLAMVQSIAMHTLTDWATFEARLGSLTQIHDLLSRTSWEGASVHHLLQQAIEPFRSPGGSPLTLTGPECELWPEAALALGMVFHELATNAAKHGALSRVGGKVGASWSLADRTLQLVWRESGGPLVRDSARRGFGLTLLQRLSFELAGRVDLDFAPTGLVCRIALPLRDVERG